MEDGYEDAVAVSSDVIIMADERQLYYSKEVSRLSVDFYKNRWLDTSAVSLVNFGDEFTNYQVART